MSTSSDAFSAVNNSGAHPVQRPLRVLLSTESAPRVALWREHLDGERFVVNDRATEFSSASPPEVIVTDQTLASADFTEFQDYLIRGEVAVVMVGRNLPADVVLPVGPSRRELRLACQLLAQVVLLRRENRKLLELSSLDPLTGLGNRRALEEEVIRLASARALVFVLFDLDQFKSVNVDLGLIKGDDVLRKVAHSLQARTRPYFTARFGGDEFVLVAQIDARETALSLVEDCRRAMSRAASLTAERPISCSAGVVLHEPSPTLARLITRADHALRAAKEAGGKQVIVAE